jgi:hypothetical protein
VNATDDLVLAVDVAAEAGITYRRMHYWLSHGYVQHVTGFTRPRDRAPELLPHEPDGGASGYSWYLTPPEARILRLIARMAGAGVHVNVAAKAARSIVETGVLAYEIGPKVFLVTVEP